jgi:hypothetical protein
VTRDELRRAIAYHREVHRPYLFAPQPGSMQDCQLPSCQAVMARLRESRGTGPERGPGPSRSQ